MKQLDENAQKVYSAATACRLNAEEVIDDIADSMEAANKMAKGLPSQSDTHDWWPKWWVTFLEEWSHKCFMRCFDKCGDSKDYQKMLNVWLSSFETLWEVGCDWVRNVRVNELKEGVSGIISRASPSQADEDAIWHWVNSFDEVALKAIELFKEKQRQAITQILKELEEYDKASLLGKLKRLLSA